MVPIGGLSEYAKSGLPTAVKGIVYGVEAGSLSRSEQVKLY